ncbi:hypothetical protein CLAFUW4_12223 [Fulvia fulva]|uniref:Heterokaryon incompatibility domain-containing protein n=1 Tax=Passalora fulva TaxID=5499 RepID=A0A9Q8USZ6_PASFU|nr:uncharacterized protein CLAFUR5_11253 [Fulvia fulva]KAK4618354.1 hypothetical protein CLAFUR4_12228 [Fulvia fulva]KAK4619155.1 hypothetical protein CLAFUR0_12239 [Fulvia fulva]UJO21297.1 hypothetical protein CLAFUR5_11253 [Fulvia fulva]WPV17910.1 hypothetical protein CLAFUW4_12223 [Fulvia fulva]WPV32805.1 hypothetical protein CLAFUW7_12230 [Fulvia fulva]
MRDWKLSIIDTGHRPSLSYQYKWGTKEQDVVLSFHTVHVADWGLPTDRSSPSTIKNLSIASGQSTQLATRIRAWLRTCEKYHRACRPSSTWTMPDRVLDLGLGPDSKIRLIRCAALSHSYAALSYCWGSTEQYRLTSETTDQLAAGVQSHDLAKTTQDAIDIAREIGLRYLWIDALCIYQDDCADWERQSANMGNIYENAALTLVASNASSTAEGFLRPRSLAEGYCGYTTYQDQKKAVYLCQPSVGFEVATVYERSDVVAHEPLSARGWAQQERLLSRRKVMFGARQMFWQCRERTCTENGLMPDDDFLGLSAFVDTKQSHASWIAAVESFSSSKLTRMSDRLPALSGLASTYCKLTGDEYLAGHWSKDLAKGSLLWRAQSPRSRPTSSTYRAPSWSWASVDGPVLYPQQERSQHLGTYFSTLGNKMSPLATLHDHCIEVKGANPFGEVTHGWLDIRAPVIPMREGALAALTRLSRYQSYANDSHTIMLYPRGESSNGSLESIFDHIWPKDIRTVEIAIDDPLTLTNSPGYCIAIAEESSTYFKADVKWVAGLIVTPDSFGETTYRRVGVFFSLYGIPLPEPTIMRLV